MEKKKYTARPSAAPAVRGEQSCGVKEDINVGRVGMCPYFQRERGNGLVYCECAKFRFPDKMSRREIVYGFCAHPDNYKKCVIKQTMDRYYERKFAAIDAERASFGGA